jgi:adenylosuccinate synthase
MISGVTHLAITKLDVLDGLKTLKMCTGYQIDGKKTGSFPADIEEVKRCKPIYKEFKGWNKIDKSSTKTADLPKAAQEYLKYIEKETGVPIAIVSIGPGRAETIKI